MTAYMEILANQRPFDMGQLDLNRRVVYAVNFRARSVEQVDTWEEDLATLISNASLGTLGTDMFLGSLAVLPDGNGPYILILDTGGITPAETMNGDIDERLSAQITVRGVPSTARPRALSIWREIHGFRNGTI
jgi:hypothetical protein